MDSLLEVMGKFDVCGNVLSVEFLVKFVVIPLLALGTSKVI